MDNIIIKDNCLIVNLKDNQHNISYFQIKRGILLRDKKLLKIINNQNFKLPFIAWIKIFQ